MADIVRTQSGGSCFLWFHDFGPWKVTNEVPLWKDSFSHTAVGAKPVGYGTDWMLIGKVLEQQRICRRCGLTDFRANRWEA